MVYDSTRKRSELEIYANILKIAAQGAKKSHLVYQNNSNHKVMQKYIEVLRKNELLEGPSERKMYKTTDKGFKYIDLAQELLKYNQLN